MIHIRTPDEMFIAALILKLGGEVVITEKELLDACNLNVVKVVDDSSIGHKYVVKHLHADEANE